MFQKNFSSDIKAGIVVFLVALPLCLGIAMACGVPLFSGIISGVVGGIVITSFSNSKYSVSGPAAGLTAIVIASIAQLGSYEAFLAAVVFAGLLQVVLGLIRAGQIGNFIPNAVIKGMLAGIGIILIIKQIPHFFGYDKDPEGDLSFIQSDGQNSFSELVNMVNYITPGSLIVGVISFTLLIFGNMSFYKKNKVLSFIPIPLLVVVFGILLTLGFSSSEMLRIEPTHLVNLPFINSVTDLTNNLMFPNFDLIQTQKFWIVVFTISIVASLETLLNIEAVDKINPEKTDTNSNRELIAQGIGNMTSGLIGGLPVTSVIVRSSANISAGAKSKWSTILHALFLIVTVLLIPNVLALIPNASLAAILIFTGYKLTTLNLFKEIWKMGLEQFIPFVITILVMLFTDLLKGVGVGIAISVIFILKDNISAAFDTNSSVIEGKLHYLIKLPQHVTFFNKGFLIRYFDSIESNSKVIIDGSINKKINADSKEVIMDFLSTVEQRNIEVDQIKINL